jgi:hypothetical protein
MVVTSSFPLKIDSRGYEIWTMTNPYEISSLEEAEAIRASVERHLPPDVPDMLRHLGLGLTLGSSASKDLPVVIDPDFAEELAETELLGKMLFYRKNVTGVDHRVHLPKRARTTWPAHQGRDQSARCPQSKRRLRLN